MGASRKGRKATTAKHRVNLAPKPKSSGPETVLQPTPASAFVTFNLRTELLQQFGTSEVQKTQDARKALNAKSAETAKFIPPTNPAAEDSPHATPVHSDPPASDMRTRNAWDRNRANPNRQTPLEDVSVKTEPVGLQRVAKRGTASKKRKQSQRASSATVDDVLVPKGVKRRRTNKSVSFEPVPVVVEKDRATFDESTEENETVSPNSNTSSDKENHDTSAMERPKLALKLSFAKPAQPGSAASPPSATPGATPTIKLKFGGNKDQDGAVKKRKRQDDEPIPTPASAGPPKIKFKTPAPKLAAPSPITPGGFRLQAKGKIPKRPLGVGYDSELSDAEKDPAILEGFMLRMAPGPDCQYLREAINKGTMGISKLQGGADVGIRVLDDKGRRCILSVRQNKYAASIVDLPCIIEGMKSWDNKRFIKSVDISQMMLVLGPIKTDEEAKNYPLPEGVSDKFSYAHGLTAPMHYVRKRRFDRTRRTRADEIEAIDRKVNALLAADAAAQHVTYEILDHDPSLDDNGDEYSESDEEEEDDDEEDADGEEDDYFGATNGNYDTPVEDIHDDEVHELEGLLGMDEDEDEDTPIDDTTSTPAAVANGAGADSFATSNADSPADVTNSAAPTAAPTPAADASTPAAATPGGTDGGDESDEDEDQDDREEQNEQAEQKSALRERIAMSEKKIDEQMGQLKVTTNNILRRRIANKIKDLQKDVGMLRRELGEEVEEGDGDEGDE